MKLEPEKSLLDLYLRDTKQAHGHLCADQVLGVRLAVLGLQKLGIEDPRGRDRKRLFTFVGIDQLTDAVAVVTGFPAWNNARSSSATGELEATFVDVETARGIRVTVQQLSKALSPANWRRTISSGTQWMKIELCVNHAAEDQFPRSTLLRAA